MDSSLTPHQKALKERLREWRRVEAAKAGKPAFIVFGDSVLEAIVRVQPTMLSELSSIAGIGPDKTDRYGAAIVALCTGQPVPEEFGVITPPQNTRQPRLRNRARTPESDSRPPLTHRQTLPNPPAETFSHTRPVRDNPGDSLTPAQQVLDQRLRQWRRSEAERLGLPQFFVLGTSTLRNIVLARPQTLSELRAIDGISNEKLEKFGAAILEACHTPNGTTEKLPN